MPIICLWNALPERVVCMWTCAGFYWSVVMVNPFTHIVAYTNPYLRQCYTVCVCVCVCVCVDWSVYVDVIVEFKGHS